METISTILVFKTDINTEARRELVGEFFKRKGIAWNVDLQDVDCVLRIETSRFSAEEVIAQVSELGYFCQELE